MLINEHADEDSNTNPASGQATRKVLPKQALVEPVKAITALLERMRKTTDGMQNLLDHYQIPPLMTAGTDMTSSFLVEVARKRGRLSRGGVPNLHSAALIVLGDLNDQRIRLPAAKTAADPKRTKIGGKGEVRVVSNMAEPFRIEGLWEGNADGESTQEKMVVDT